ncbi:MAG: hypothetical protein Q8R28_14905 [Dehalococcoidia bacterium]|nr:hypothetical protein [Dehalococcoidia bacterium]
MTATMAYVWTLPRWFGAPVAWAAVALGYYVAGGTGTPFALAMSLVSMSFLMAWAHSMNTWLDYFWTGLDREGPGRSHSKPYTAGSQVIANGTLSGHSVLAASLMYLAVSLGALLAVVAVNPWVVIPWTAGALCTFWYSWGKLHYQCELALGMGFGPLAALMGAAAVPDAPVLPALLAGLPIMLAFGFAAETYDQWYDADENIPRGLRNIGALIYRKGWRIDGVVSVLLLLAFASHLALIAAGVFSVYTLVAFAVLPLLMADLPKAGSKNTAVALRLLFDLFGYVILLAVGQALA